MRPPTRSHSALVAATAAVMPQKKAASGAAIAIAAAAIAVMAAHALAPSRVSPSRTVAADPAHANSQPNASSTASVSARRWRASG